MSAGAVRAPPTITGHRVDRTANIRIVKTAELLRLDAQSRHGNCLKRGGRHIDAF